MQTLGIWKANHLLRWVLVRKEKSVIIEREEESLSIPKEILSIKNLKIVTALDNVLRRDFKLPIAKERALKNSLPFQLEPLLPFSLEKAVVYPQFYIDKNETFVVSWSTTESSLQSHLEEWNKEGIDPDLVSAKTLALARWARYAYPGVSQLFVTYDNIGIALDQDCVLCALESPDPIRLKIVLNQKYPHFTEVQSHSFSIPLGLALEPYQKEGCQFRLPDALSQREHTRQRSLLKKIFVAGTACICLSLGLSSIILHQQERKLKNDLADFGVMPSGPLITHVNQFRAKLIQQMKKFPPLLELPTTEEVLAWISTLTSDAEMIHLEYELREENCIFLTLEFQASSKEHADRFVQLLKKTPTFVDPTTELKWTSLSSNYKISFPLRKKH